jgi:hypothetical protein
VEIDRGWTHWEVRGSLCALGYADLECDSLPGDYLDLLPNWENK